ncbi:hypothetical protein [Streptomyces sp. MC1]|nr:hypothetical protein [Streptomyces sp. MC1]
MRKGWAGQLNKQPTPGDLLTIFPYGPPPRRRRRVPGEWQVLVKSFFK